MEKKSLAFVFFLVFLFFIVPGGAWGVFDCSELNSSSRAEEKEFCKSELAAIEKELAALLEKQAEQQKHTGTLKGDISYLASQIKALQTKVKAQSLKIAELRLDIKEKSARIEILSEKMERERASLAQLLRNTNEFDSKNFAYLIFSEGSISDFYNDVESYSSIKQAIKKSVDQIRGIKDETETQKRDLERKQDAELDAKTELENAERKANQSEKEKQKLLILSKQKESEYKKLADERKARANRIRSALFSLAGISEKIEFGTALEYANAAKAKTGVDPAFVLAILTQESNLGSNVGKCYLTDKEGPRAGYGVNISTGETWTNLMKPERDIKPFLEITSALGLDPLKTVVSCPISGVAGYGGAMGPAQFIPSTWKIYESQLEGILGYSPNPWSPRDAFMASAVYLADLGAKGTSASAQHRAACKYYGTGGSTCSYSRSVMKIKNRIQDDIDLLSA